MSARLRHRDIDADPNAEGDLTQIWGSNPQAGRSESSFSSAVRRNDTTPSKRCRGSDGLTRRGRTDHDPWHVETVSGPHSRSRTVDDDICVGADSFWSSRSRSTSQHPLRSSSSLASSSSWTLDHDTRPSMKRVLSDYDPLGFASDGDRPDAREGSLVQHREMLVIVHEVQPKDSLAGVALKYGITLPDLRRANQLWTSDSIHLRKVLHIPVDKTRHARLFREALTDSNPSSESLFPKADPPTAAEADGIPSTQEALPDIGKLTIRRVPVSQLSYFPPPTHSSSSLDKARSPKIHTSATLPNGKGSRNRPPLPLSFSGSKDGPLQGVLDVFSSSLQTTTQHIRASTTSLFGQPIPRAPATLVSRLSLDSASGTPSSASDDFDWEHEMEDVSAAKTSRRPNGITTSPPNTRSRARTHAREASESLNDLHVPRQSAQEQEARDSVELDSGPFRSSAGPLPSPRTPTHRHRRSSSGRSQYTSNPSGSPSAGRARTKQGQTVPYAGTEEVAERGSPKGASAVRTAQMEPSPGMQLPLMVRRTKSTDS